MQQRGHRVKVVTYSGQLPVQAASTDEIASEEYVYDGVPVLAYRSQAADPAQSPSILEDPRLSAWAEALPDQGAAELNPRRSCHARHRVRAGRQQNGNPVCHDFNGLLVRMPAIDFGACRQTALRRAGRRTGLYADRSAPPRYATGNAHPER